MRLNMNSTKLNEDAVVVSNYKDEEFVKETLPHEAYFITMH